MKCSIQCEACTQNVGVSQIIGSNIPYVVQVNINFCLTIYFTWNQHFPDLRSLILWSPSKLMSIITSCIQFIYRFNNYKKTTFQNKTFVLFETIIWLNWTILQRWGWPQCSLRGLKSYLNTKYYGVFVMFDKHYWLCLFTAPDSCYILLINALINLIYIRLYETWEKYLLKLSTRPPG